MTPGNQTTRVKNKPLRNSLQTHTFKIAHGGKRVLHMIVTTDLFYVFCFVTKLNITSTIP